MDIGLPLQGGKLPPSFLTFFDFLAGDFEFMKLSVATTE